MPRNVPSSYPTGGDSLVSAAALSANASISRDPMQLNLAPSERRPTKFLGGNNQPDSVQDRNLAMLALITEDQNPFAQRQRRLWLKINDQLPWYNAQAEALERRIKRLLLRFSKSETCEKMIQATNPRDLAKFKRYDQEQFRVLRLLQDANANSSRKKRRIHGINLEALSAAMHPNPNLSAIPLNVTVASTVGTSELSSVPNTNASTSNHILPVPSQQEMSMIMRTDVHGHDLGGSGSIFGSDAVHAHTLNSSAILKSAIDAAPQKEEPRLRLLQAQHEEVMQQLLAGQQMLQDAVLAMQEQSKLVKTMLEQKKSSKKRKA